MLSLGLEGVPLGYQILLQSHSKYYNSTSYILDLYIGNRVSNIFPDLSLTFPVPAGAAVWQSGSVVARINEVTVHRTRMPGQNVHSDHSRGNENCMTFP